MIFKKKTKKFTKKVLIILIITTCLLGIYIIYPSILEDIDFLKHESISSLNKFNFKNVQNQQNIPSCPDCNIILISLDTLRADHLGIYDYKRNTSPNIDKFAEESMIFKNSFSNGYNTLPSHMSIFTSLYPTTHQINYIDDLPLSSNFKTFAEMLKNKNYNTLWVGPLNDQNLNFNQGFGRGFNQFNPTILNYSGFDKNSFSDILEQNQKKKFFMFIHSYINHGPYIYPEKFNSKFSNKNYPGNLPQTYNMLLDSMMLKMKNDLEENQNLFLNKLSINNEQKIELIEILESKNLSLFKQLIFNIDFIKKIPTKYHPQFIYYDTIREDISEEDITELSDNYDNGVYYVDYLFSELLDELEKKNLLNNTIIIITSDHGEELYEHEGFDHNNFYDYTINVPLIIKIPGIKTKIEYDGLTQSIDILPTVLTLSGTAIPENTQGENLVNSLEKGIDANEYVFGYSLGNMYIRSKKWKYMKHNDGKEELYYLVKDSLEKQNLIKSESLIVKKIKKRLKNKLQEWIVKEHSENIPEVYTISDNDIIKIQLIKNLSEKEGFEYANNQKYLLNGLFNKQKVPYPGPLTNILDCPEKYLPQFEEENNSDSWKALYYLYSNDRLTFGGCTEDILTYSAVLGFIYCKEKKELYHIEYFTPKENPTPDYKEIVKSFNCNK